VDGNTSGNWNDNSLTHTGLDGQAWWQVDLGSVQSINSISVFNRTDCCGDRVSDFYVLVSDSPFLSNDLAATRGQVGVSAYHVAGQAGTPTSVPVNRSGRYVRVQLTGTNYLSLAEVQVWGAGSGLTNLALNRPSTQSSDPFGAPASRAVDGNTSGIWSANSVTHTGLDTQAWWQVDLGSVQSIQSVNVWNRTDCCGDRLGNFYILVSDVPFTSTDLNASRNQAGVSSFSVPGVGGTPTAAAVNRTGRYVRVQLSGTNYLALAEVEVLGSAGEPSANLAQGKPATQSSDPFGAPASRAVDGSTDGNWSNNSVTHTNFDSQAWWQVDLGSVQSIQSVQVWNRTDAAPERLSNFYVFVSDQPFTSTGLNATLGQAGVSAFLTAGQGGTPTAVSVNRTGRYVRVQLSGTNYLSLAEVQVFGSTAGPVHLAQGKPATQSSDPFGAPASRAADGNTAGNWSDGSLSHTGLDNQAWWQVDLGGVQSIGVVRVWNRADCCGSRLSNFYVLVSDTPFASTDLTATLNQAGVSSFFTPGAAGSVTEINVGRTGRYVRVQLSGTDYLSLAEVQVWAPVSRPNAGTEAAAAGASTSARAALSRPRLQSVWDGSELEALLLRPARRAQPSDPHQSRLVAELRPPGGAGRRPPSRSRAAR
jgi:hypothetical protein